MNDDTVEYKKTEIIEVLRHLNQIVVSLDRIGSEFSDHSGKSDEELNAVLTDFIFGWRVLEKLAYARRVLGETFSDELGDDDMGEEERFCQDLKYWSAKNPSPPV